MSTVKKAVVLAAGFGTRLSPLTVTVPKPLLPVWGEPMLARIVAFLRELGVSDIVVNCHYHHEQVEEWCAANDCRASYESEILGTGGVLNPLRDWIGEDDFYLVNGDIVLENFKGFKRFSGFAKNEIGWCLVTEEGPRTIEVEPESGWVTNWKSDDAGYPGTFTYCGFALLKAKILDYVEPTGFSSIVQAYERAMMTDGLFVKSICPKNLLWEDAGTIQKYIDVNQDGEDNAFVDIPQLKRIGCDSFKFLSARGSDRLFFDCDKGVAIIYDDSKRAENARYAGHARWLKERGVSVPEVVYDDPATKTLVLEHVGCEKKMTLEEYAEVVKALAFFNALECPLELESAFDDALWRWERELFREHCLGARFSMELSAEVEAELVRVAQMLEKEPKALVHRDFQSTNVLWKGGKPSFIDFQGMRKGPAAYDLASLVYDPYVKLSEKTRAALVALYAKEAKRPEIVEILPFAAVQRLVQCLGAYGRLASVGQSRFSQYVLPALENLLEAADSAGLDAIGALAEDLIAREQHAREHHHHHHHE